MRYQKAPVVLITLIIIILFTNKSYCSNIVARKPVSIKTDKIIILENVPYISQIGRLDCGFASRAMLLNYFDKNFDSASYPKSMYETASCYSFVYYPATLILPYGGRIDDEYEWLASLYGLSYKRIVPRELSDSQDAWNEYINRIWGYLQEGIPVQTTISWPEAKEEKGKLYILSEFRPFWWEGITKKNRPQIHQIVVVGLDKSKGVIYVNSPWGWLGMGKYMEIGLGTFKELIKNVPLHTRYCTRVFRRSNASRKDEGLKEKLINQRIVKKLKGDPEVYDKPALYRLYGLEGVKALKNDLRPIRFSEILKIRMQKEGISPAEALIYLNLGLYQYSFKASIVAEYLEIIGKMEEGGWTSNLHILYEKLYILNGKLVVIFKSYPDFEQALKKSKPILEEMRRILDESIYFIQRYPAKV